MARHKRADNTLTVKAISIPVRYTKNDIEWMRKKYKPGQMLEITKLKVDGEEICRPQRKKYMAVATFPFHVSCMDRYGRRESFGYFELEQIMVE